MGFNLFRLMTYDSLFLFQERACRKCFEKSQPSQSEPSISIRESISIHIGSNRGESSRSLRYSLASSVARLASTGDLLFDGGSTLLTAAAADDLSRVQFLVLGAHVDPSERDSEGLTALDLAKRKGHANVENFLKELETGNELDLSEFGPRYGSVDELIALLVSDLALSEEGDAGPFSKLFLLQFPCFLTPVELLEKLTSFLQQPRPSDAQAVNEWMQKRFHARQVLALWSKRFPSDFRELPASGLSAFLSFPNADPEDAGLARSEGFLRTAQAQNLGPAEPDAKPVFDIPENPGEADWLLVLSQQQAWLRRHLRALDTRPRENVFLAIQKFIDQGHFQQTTKPLLAVREWAPSAVAVQLSLLDFSMLKFLRERQFVAKEWTRRGSSGVSEQAADVGYMVDVFNKRSYWAASVVLAPSSLDFSNARAPTLIGGAAHRDRRAALSWLIEVCEVGINL